MKPDKSNLSSDARTDKSLLHVARLSLHVHSKTGRFTALKDISFELRPGETLGLIGPSGAGKSLLASTLSGLLQDEAIFRFEGSALWSSKNQTFDILSAHPKILQQYRRSEVALIFQDPYASLTPNLSCGKQIAEVLRLHEVQNLRSEALKLIQSLGFDDPKRIYQAYPHQLSGGECQRIVICCILASKAKLIIADEAVSSLDKEHGQQVMEALTAVKEKLAAALLLISHDSSLIEKYTDRYIRLDKGRIVEKAVSTQALAPKKRQRKRVISTKDTEPLIQLKSIGIRYPVHSSKSTIRQKYVQVLQDFDLTLYRGEILGLVGPSGSGKSSIAKAIVRAIPIYAGQILYHNRDISQILPFGPHPIRRKIQLITQDHTLSFNPAYPVGVALKQVRKANPNAISDKEFASLKQELGLEDRLLKLFPQQLSGGQGQRFNILRALLLRPDLLICDECTNALDYKTKYEILDLLDKLNRTHKLSILLISHDLQSIQYLCDRYIVGR